MSKKAANSKAVNNKEELDLDAVAQEEPIDYDDFDDSPEARGDYLGDEEFDEDEVDDVDVSDEDDGDTEVDIGDDDDDEADDDEPDEETEDDEDDEETEDDEDDEDSESEEADDEKDSKSSRHRKNKNVLIPKARFDQVNQKRKALEKKVKSLENAHRNSDEFSKQLGDIDNQIDSVSKQLDTALAEGEAEQISKLRAQERSLLSQRSRIELEQQREIVRQDARFDAAVDRIEADFDVLNPESESYDDNLTREVIELADGFTNTGRYTRDAALYKAVQVLVPRYEEEQIAEAYQEEEAEEQQGLRAANKRTTQRRKMARKKAQATQRKQPKTPRTRAPAKAPKRVDIMSMTDEEFDKWADSKEGRIARGDFIA